MRAPRKTALLLVVALLSPAVARADCHCFCKGATAMPTGSATQPHQTTTLKDLGQLATYNAAECLNKTYTQNDCKTKCKSAVNSDANLNNKTWICQQVKKEGEVSRWALWGIATGNYVIDFDSQLLMKCRGGVTTCKCPAGSAANAGAQANQDGGITTDGKCKRAAGTLSAPYSGTSLPANGTQLGNWGFSWGSAMYQWVTPACTTAPWTGS